MIDYETYCKIRLFHQERGLSFNQIAAELGLRPQTVAKYANLATFTRRRGTKRPSKLDPFKPAIARWLERHPYSATQIYQRLWAEEGYTGGFSIVTAHVRAVRPARHPAFLSSRLRSRRSRPSGLGQRGNHHPGQHPPPTVLFRHGPLPQPDGLCGVRLRRGHGTLPRLPPQRPGVLWRHPRRDPHRQPQDRVLRHPVGERAAFNPRYLDFAAHCGFEARACNYG